MIIVWIFVAFIVMGFTLTLVLMSTVIGGKITGERTITVVVKRKK